MTTALAVIGLTYASTDIQEADLGIFFVITQGLNEAPEVRGRDFIVPGMDGQVARNRRSDHLDILLAGNVRGNGVDEEAQRSDYRTNARAVRTLFNPNRDPADLVATLEDGSTWTIECRPDGSPIWNEQIVSQFAYVSVKLYSVAPDWSIDEGS
jgi:hypothetical protein